jgi:uncharacterized phage protein (predicted DNA packaging)
MIVSNITIDDLKNYLHIYTTDDDTLLTNILTASRAFVSSYTGLSADLMDSYEDISVAVMIIASDMYDVRTYTVDSVKINPVVETILSLHSVNFL